MFVLCAERIKWKYWKFLILFWLDLNKLLWILYILYSKTIKYKLISQIPNNSNINSVVQLRKLRTSNLSILSNTLKIKVQYSREPNLLNSLHFLVFYVALPLQIEDSNYQNVWLKETRLWKEACITVSYYQWTNYKGQSRSGTKGEDFSTKVWMYFQNFNCKEHILRKQVLECSFFTSPTLKFQLHYL